MLLTLLLDGHFAEGALVDFFGLLLVVGVLLVLLLVLWSRHIEQQFDREPEPEVPTAPSEAATRAEGEEGQH